ncbi:ATP-binding protein [Mucilaginibacter gilvus]|uniref:ATP-binding protein n=1 Tax=Mucilaginibacter gilvus TaxID=2305909 RepID=A0A3S3YU27_9SPHI|nr:HAMP domain-containing histidine kinase [Mucilaginibacter gilvus]RWY50316.1 ATP-binding protein [Mucilaginibacter gilvus]
MAASISKQLIFNYAADELYPLVLEGVHFLQQKTAMEDGVLPKVKLVLMELLTNALKHNGGAQTEVWLQVDKGNIIIKKTDKGNPLVIHCGGINHEWPLPGNHQAGRKVCIYSGNGSNLNAAVKNNCLVQFLVEETGPEETDLLRLPEHFGLMIIARACSRFAYEFDIDTCTNTFTAVIPLTDSTINDKYDK